MKNLPGLILLVMWSTPLWADVPKLLNYQGRLTDSENKAVADDDYIVNFRLYISEAEVNSVWNETQTITTKDGYFHTLLGQVNALTSSIFNQPLWLGIQIQGELEMTPRQQLTSSPGAMTVADGTITADKVAKGWGIVPAGSIVLWPMSTPPSGWLECNGQMLNQTNYPELFNAIGNTYGGTAPEFKLPDFRGIFPRGWDHGAGKDPDANARTDRGDGTVGDKIGTKQDEQLKMHLHIMQVYTCTENYPGPGNNAGAWAYPYNNGTQHSTGIAGGNETRPKNINVMYIIKY